MVRAADGWDGKRSVSNRSMERDSSMVQLFLIGLGAGTATALLFASVASGSPLSVLLFYLAPLPILIAALGWSHWAALVAAVAASAGLAAVFGGFFFLTFLLGVGLPAWWLGYLALLARPTAAGAPGTLEWYPVGHIVFWAAIIAASIVIAAMLHFETSGDGFHASLRKGLERALRVEQEATTPAPAGRDMSRLIDFLLAALPPAAAVLTTITSVVNLWLAERIARISGRLRRPSPEFSAMRLPGFAGALAAAALAASFLPGMSGIFAGVLGAALLMAYAIVGFAVLHAITRGMSGRPFALAGLYAAVAMFGWPVLAMSLLGVADAAFDFRARLARRRQPPPNPNT
jgi:hypothetical protein